MKKSEALSKCVIAACCFTAAVLNTRAEELEIPPVKVQPEYSSATAEGEPTAAVTVIEREEIERSGAASVLELISGRVPGVLVTERGVMGYGLGPGAAGNISIRGLGGVPNSRVLVLIDGAPAMMGMFGHPIPDAYPLEGVERVEVFRGSNSLRFGSGAMGGVVNIVTREAPEEGYSTRLYSGFGEFGSFRAGFDHAGRPGPVSYSVAISHQRTDGHRPNSVFYSTNSYGSIAYDFSDPWRLKLGWWGGDFSVDDPGPITSPSEEDRRQARRGGLNLSLANSHADTWGEILLHAQQGNHDFTRFDGWKSVDRTIGVSARQSILLSDDNRLEAGADISREGGRGENVESGYDYGRYFQTQGGLYVDDEHRFGDRFLVQGGLRLHFARQGSGSPHLIPRAGALYNIFPDTELRAMASSGWRAPNVRELFLFPPSSLDLKPEKSWNYEVGVRQQLGRLVSLDLTAFYVDAENLIVFLPPKASNTGRVKNRGVEIEVLFRHYAWMETVVGYAYLDQDEEQEGFASHNFKGINRFYYRALVFQIEADWIGDLRLGDEKESFWPTGLRLGWKFAPGWEGSVAVNNVFDQEYSLVQGYPAPGRWVWGEMSYRF